MPSRRKPKPALADASSGGANIATLIRASDGRAPRILIGAAELRGSARLHRIFTAAGCCVEAAGHGGAVLAAAMREIPDLVVIDAPLPRLPGLALLRRLRANPALRWLPVVVLAERASEPSWRERVLDAGASDCLIKPVAARDLLSRAGLHLTMARMGRELIAAVSASERHLSEVLQAIGDAVFAIDRDERFLFANRRALELWKRCEDEVVGRLFAEVFPGIEHRELYRAYRRALETGEPVHLEAPAPVLGERWIELDAHPAPNGGLVVAFRDIDGRKRQEARLRESEERFRLMLEALPDIAFVIAPDGAAVHYNRQLRDYAGATIGPAPADRAALHPAEDRQRVDAAHAYGFAKGADFTVEARMRRHDGTYRWHRIHNRPVRIGGEIAFWVGTAVDIDDMRGANALLERRVTERTAELKAANRGLAAQIEERERAEAQLRQAQRIEAVGQLTSGVAHDFNNLLTAVIGNLELLETRLGDRDERAAQFVAAAQAAAERGARLTAQLLAFSRQQRLTPEPVDINRTVANVRTLLHSTIGATIRIETVLSETLWPALADASQIELVLLNLAINARDAMPLGGAITIETANMRRGPPQRAEEPPPGDYVVVSVADSGTGIPAEILDRVFDPFFTTKEVGKGSGLGLSQVLGVAQQLGGGVGVDTRPGEGTTIKVYLPRAAEEGVDSGIVEPVIQPRRSRSEPRHGLILLVDDDSDVRGVAATILRQAGHQVLEAGSGSAALDRLDQVGDEIELMIADIAMPGMNGIELGRSARQRRPDLPILFITGFAGSAVPPDLAGREQILRKPFRAAEINARVAAILGRPDKIVRLKSRRRGAAR